MNLFSQQTPKTDPAKLSQIKTWVYELLAVDTETSVSISQLRCTEPNCPPVETVIAVMATPTQTFKIHKPVADIERADILQLRQS